VGGRGHGHREAQRELLAHVPDVMDGAAWYPHDVVLRCPHDDPAGQLPLEAPGEDDPPLVEVPVPVGAIAAAGRAGDQRDQLALVGDEATVKTYYPENGQIRLQPENDTMQPIIIRRGDPEVRIVGKVSAVLRKM